MARFHAVAALGLALALAGLAGSGCSGEQGRVGLAEVHLRAGDTYLAENKLDAALREFEQARDLAPEHLPTHVKIGVVRARQGRLGEAADRFRKVTEEDPGYAEAWELWGAMLASRGQLVEALPKLERALEAEPGRVGALRQLGQTLVSLRRNEEAIAIFERLAEQESDHPAQVLTNWGTALQRLGRDGEARSRYEQALRSEPDHVPALNNLGLMLVRSPDPAEQQQGVERLEAALRQKPGDPVKLHNVGWAYLETGRPAEAYSLLLRAVAATDASDPRRKEREGTLEKARARLPNRPAAADAPNILLVAIDTLRADHLGSYGYTRPTSPTLDALAARGVLFEQAVSQAPWTAASFGSLFTSLYPSVHGLDGGVRWGPGQSSAGGSLPFAVQKILPIAQPTLAEMLRRNGYRTAGFVSNVYVNSIFGFSQGFEVYNDEHRDYSRNVGGAKRRAEETNEFVFRWLDEPPGEPFFLFVHYNDPHWPYNPPAPHGAEWVAGYQGELTPEKSSAVVETQGEPIEDLSPEDLAYLIALYDGEISYVDSHIAKLLERVRGLDTERDLLVVVTADHGEEFLDHGSASHGYTLYEELIHVPLIFHAPGRLAPRRVPAQVRSIDVLPTVLALAGIAERPEGIQGESLVALMKGETDQGPLVAFSEATYVGERRSVRQADGLKLIRSLAGEADQLFDLRDDPDERQNLLTGEAEPPEGLVDRLAEWVHANKEIRTALFGEEGAGQEIVLDAETRERLEALGYIQ